MGLFSRNVNAFANVNQNALPDKTGKWYKRINTISIVGIFVAVAIIVLSMFKIFTMSAFLFGVVGTIAIVCASLILTLPWISKYEKKFHSKLSLGFIIAIGVCGILWLICLYLGIGVYKKAVANSDSAAKTLLATINFIKISLILSLQLLVASVAATGMLKYKKTNYFLQGICYASYLFFDFYMTFALACIKIGKPGTKDVIDVADGIKILGNKYMVVSLVLAIIFIAISNVIMTRDDSRKMQDAIASVVEQQPTSEVRKTETQDNIEKPEDKLAKLKSMYENELITKEEYEIKKADILKDM